MFEIRSIMDNEFLADTESEEFDNEEWYTEILDAIHYGAVLEENNDEIIQDELDEGYER